ncbi:MAG: hypothetical protein HFE59_05705 [Clostridiales bacterium]|jgi:hypothetical protein|nr:hypothetical protein [Clostridiales bacterium]
MTFLDWVIIIAVIIGAIFAGLYFLNKWAYKKMDTQQTMINKMKNSMSIYVIDKKRDKITNINMPKAVIDQMPKLYKKMKMYFVQAKIGPQIMTLMCDKKVFAAIPVKKNIKVEIAGIYIVSVAGMKSPEELKAIKKQKKEKAKEEAKAAKAVKKNK